MKCDGWLLVVTLSKGSLPDEYVRENLKVLGNVTSGVPGYRAASMP